MLKFKNRSHKRAFNFDTLERTGDGELQAPTQYNLRIAKVTGDYK